MSTAVQKAAEKLEQDFKTEELSESKPESIQKYAEATAQYDKAPGEKSKKAVVDKYDQTQLSFRLE